MEPRNRHPADELADIRAEIRRLQEREEKLRAYLVQHPSDRMGIDYEALVTSQQRKDVDLPALAAAIGQSVLDRFTSSRSYRLIRLRERERSEEGARVGSHDQPVAMDQAQSVDRR